MNNIMTSGKPSLTVLSGTGLLLWILTSLTKTEKLALIKMHEGCLNKLHGGRRQELNTCTAAEVEASGRSQPPPPHRSLTSPKSTRVCSWTTRWTGPLTCLPNRAESISSGGWSALTSAPSSYLCSTSRSPPSIFSYDVVCWEKGPEETEQTGLESGGR